MASTYNGKGYAGPLRENLTAPAMAKALQGETGALAPGDQLLLYYAGHGDTTGLVGVAHEASRAKDVLAHGVVGAAVTAAQSKGAYVTAIIDACHSGALTATIRKERIEDLASEPDLPGPARALLPFVKRIEAVRDEIRRAERSPLAPATTTRDAAEGGLSRDIVPYGEEGEGAGRDAKRVERDASPEMIALSRATHPRLSAVAGDFRAATASGRLGEVLPGTSDWTAASYAKKLDVCERMAHIVLEEVERARSGPGG